MHSLQEWFGCVRNGSAAWLEGKGGGEFWGRWGNSSVSPHRKHSPGPASHTSGCVALDLIATLRSQFLFLAVKKHGTPGFTEWDLSPGLPRRNFAPLSNRPCRFPPVRGLEKRWRMGVNGRPASRGVSKMEGEFPSAGDCHVCPDGV